MRAIGFKKHSIAVVALLSIILGLATLIGLYFSFLKSYDELDQKSVQEDAERAYRTFNERLNILESKVGDWGAWDEAFKFVMQQDQDFAAANFTKNVVSGLKISLVAYLAADLSPLAVREMMEDKLITRAATDFAFLSNKHPLITGSNDKTMLGIVSLDGRPAIAAAKRVSRGDGSGPPAGRVVFVRAIDAEMLSTLTDQTLLKMGLEDDRSKEERSRVRGRYQKLDIGEIEFLESMAVAHLPLRALDGAILGILRVEIPREIAIFGRASAKGLIGIVVVFVAGVIGVLFLILRLSGAKDGVERLLNANELLKQREAHLSALVDSVPGYVSWFDKSLKYLGVNKKLARDYGESPEFFVGKIIGFHDPNSSPDLKNELEQFFKDEARSKQSTIFMQRGNDKLRFLICFEKYNDDQSVVVVGIDTTSSWKSEMQSVRDKQIAINASRLSALGEMAGGIAHEINNPLAIIQAGCWKLNKKLTQIGQAEHCKGELEIIESTTFRISKIVSGLRSFARDGGNDNFEVVGLESIVNDVIALCSERFRNHGVELRRPSMPIQAAIKCRQVQIGQVLINLLNNSFDAVLPLRQKWVEIDFCERDGHAEVSVTDSGSGIPNDVLEKMMEPFFTTKPVGKGTGLGLSISEGIINDHAGELIYDRDAKNTRFVIKLPRSQSEGQVVNKSIKRESA